MKDVEFLKELVERGRIAEDGYFEFAHLVACHLPKRLHEQLAQLINGPVYDGDVVSKSDRDELIDLGLATRICCKGGQGHTGAIYFAKPVLDKIHDIKTGKIGA